MADGWLLVGLREFSKYLTLDGDVSGSETEGDFPWDLQVYPVVVDSWCWFSIQWFSRCLPVDVCFSCI